VKKKIKNLVKREKLTATHTHTLQSKCEIYILFFHTQYVVHIIERTQTELFGYLMRLSISPGSISLICIETFHAARLLVFNNLLTAENTPRKSI